MKIGRIKRKLLDGWDTAALEIPVEHSVIGGFGYGPKRNERIVRVELRGKLDGSVAISVKYRMKDSDEWRRGW